MKKEPETETEKQDQEMSQFGSWKFKVRLFRIDQPLWLPKGSVRAILTLTVILTAMYCFMVGIPIDETFKMLIATVIAFYFGSRLNFSEEKKPEGQ